MHVQESWRSHPLCVQGVVELVPTQWLWKYWGRDVSPKTELKDGTRVGLEELWDNIVLEGLHDPLIMRVGLQNKKFRLEAGNHRIQVLHEHGVTDVPVTVQIRDECGPHVSDVMTDASHNFDVGDDLLITSVSDEYLRPSEVFISLHALKGGTL